MNVLANLEENVGELTLKAAVIYDEFDLATRATAFLQQVAGRTDELMRWDIRPWRVNLLQSSDLAAVAHDEIRDADLIVLALGRTHLLPEALLDWLEGWAGRREIPDAALMVLCPEETAGPASSWGRLRRFAEDQGLAFLGRRPGCDPEDSDEEIQCLCRQKRPPPSRLSWPAGSWPGRPAGAHRIVPPK